MITSSCLNLFQSSYLPKQNTTVSTEMQGVPVLFLYWVIFLKCKVHQLPVNVTFLWRNQMPTKLDIKLISSFKTVVVNSGEGQGKVEGRQLNWSFVTRILWSQYYDIIHPCKAVREIWPQKRWKAKTKNRRVHICQEKLGHTQLI